jgi:lipopolysaccharide export system permease protein
MVGTLTGSSHCTHALVATVEFTSASVAAGKEEDCLMEIIDKYLARAVLGGVLSVLAVLVTLDAIISFAGDADKIGHASYTLWSAIEFTLFRIPRQAYALFPLAVLLGTVLGLGMLASSGELVVIRAAGVSLLRIIFSVMKAAMVLIVLAMVIGEAIAPPLTQYAQIKKARTLSQQISLNTDYGLWARDGQVYIHVRRVESDGRLTGIQLYRFDDQQQLVSTTSAASARHQGDQWLLNKVTRTELSPSGAKQQHLDHLTWKSLLKPELVDVVSILPEFLSVWKLNDYIGYLKENNLDSALYELSFWNKLMMPLTIAAMVLLAVPFVFGSRRQGGVGQRIFIGFLAGLVFYIVDQLIGQVSVVYSIPPWLGASFPTFLILSLGIYSIRRIR